MTVAEEPIPLVTEVSSSRQLLARLRDVMAASGGAPSRLDKIVRLIAAEMEAEVCSAYAVRPGDVLELFATVGLNPEAVHRTRLRVGEGLVGEVAATARSVAIANAPSHPSFAYRPETGEEAYHSLLGVPILRGGRVRGVLVIQHRERRNYSEEEVENLQTVAMVVAELVAGEQLVASSEIAGDSAGSVLPSRIEGVTLNAGLAQGVAVLHRPQLTVREMVAEDPAAEQARLWQAVEAMHSSLDALLASAADQLAESQDILETYRMFAEDRGWLNRITDAINTGLTAEAAVQRVQDDMRARMDHMTDPYLRERLADFEDLANRLLLHLAGKTSAAAAAGTLPENVVLVARSIGPAELLDYDQRRLRALVLEEGSAASHVAIVARALDIPVVGQCDDVLSRIELLDPVIVDGDNGQIFIRPAEDVQAVFNENAELRDRRRLEMAGLVKLPAESRDGVGVSLHINAGLLLDMPHIRDTGADGVGLYRTEIPFMVRASYPDVQAQTELYSRVLDQAEGKPVVFRTLDIGGDKRLPYFADLPQENPALGWRAIRIGLDRPAMLRNQLRALLRASNGRPIGIMFPMVAEVAELEAARRLLALEFDRAGDDGIQPPEAVSVGVMIEVPSLLWQLPALLARVDFVSVGSNDLMQYLFASDRGNPKLAQRYDPLSPIFLNVMRDLIARCDEADVPISVCGEMAGRPLEAMALVGLGLRRLSAAPAAIGGLKTMIRSLNVAALSDYLAELCASDQKSVRGSLRAFASDRGVAL